MHSIYFKNYLYIYNEPEKYVTRPSLVATVTQQLDRDTGKATPNATSTFAREWRPANPARRPIFPEQMLKLRNVNVVLIEDRCKGCSYCIEFCPRKVFEQSKKLNKIGIHPPRIKDDTLCVGCGVCEEICPDFAIFLVEKETTNSPKEE
jgi:2-oxoglutarate ferredoxin oxidoreductase subunit delta